MPYTGQCMINTLLPTRNNQPVCRAPDSFSSAIQDVSINHRGANVAVPQKLLHGPDIISVLEQMRGERMTECVTSGWLKYMRFDSCFLESLLEDGFVKMMPMLITVDPVGVMTRSRKDPLPSPFFWRVRILFV